MTAGRNARSPVFSGVWLDERFQALPRDFDGDFQRAGVKALWLTASGGPFRTLSAEAIAAATPAQAVAHPNWVMGRKISVDSASLMNKGLEVIEARWLFNARPDQIKVVVHPQSIVHSMVEYADGSVIAQMGTPDMRTPIAYALGFPERIDAGVSPLELMGKQLTFEAPDTARFPCLQLAFDALAAGGNAAAVLNAANEIAVARFLDDAVPFNAIAASISHTLDVLAGGPADTLDDLLDADRQGHRRGRRHRSRCGHPVLLARLEVRRRRQPRRRPWPPRAPVRLSEGRGPPLGDELPRPLRDRRASYRPRWLWSIGRPVGVR